MKLADAAKYLKEIDDEDRGRVPPISGGGTISTKQAAKELGVSVSRVRQMLGGGGEKKHLDSEKPQPGDRDHEIKLKDVQQLKKNKPKKGRPEKGGKDKDDDSDGDKD